MLQVFPGTPQHRAPERRFGQTGAVYEVEHDGVGVSSGTYRVSLTLEFYDIITASPPCQFPPSGWLFFTSAGDNSLPSFPLIPEIPTGSAADDNDKNHNCRNNWIIGDKLLHSLQTF